MTKHERWVIYPLLFLSIGMWFRDRVLPIHRTEVVANEVSALEIKVGRLKCDQLLANSIVAGNEIEIRGADERPIVIIGPGKGAGLLEMRGRDAQPMVRLSGNLEGTAGVAELWSHPANKKRTELAGQAAVDEPIEKANGKEDKK